MRYEFQEDYKSNYKNKTIEYVIKNGCFECVSHSPEKNGYFSIRRNGIRQKLHRYIYRITVGEIPKDMVVRHKCDNRLCINPNHLEIGTQLDNIRDRVERNRSAKQNGTDNGMCSIDEETVLKVLFDNDGTQHEIADRYGISQIHVSQIKTGKRWRHVTEKYNCYLNVKIRNKLSESEIIEVYIDKVTSTRDLSRKYQVSESVISNIRNKKRYTNITREYENLPNCEVFSL